MWILTYELVRQVKRKATPLEDNDSKAFLEPHPECGTHCFVAVHSGGALFIGMQKIVIFACNHHLCEVISSHHSAINQCAQETVMWVKIIES